VPDFAENRVFHRPANPISTGVTKRNGIMVILQKKGKCILYMLRISARRSNTQATVHHLVLKRIKQWFPLSGLGILW
jgi:hypothetical protein